ncbi:hypothetical protein EH165_07840 [Nakamurella antarctica]|uniref:Uncharacterized protein n=1 Tax=Nakamurella antarctica TaxID=1902245 RepID=A0A3G8ZUB1_9ACTN|nr:hypothetical protein [Nakamurella antarctica]AZI58064.1 hypothetical protein EH165_07840 [Nakamurella antarctica]
MSPTLGTWLDAVFARVPKWTMNIDAERLRNQAIKHLSSLVARHGAEATAVVESMGRSGVRIVIVAVDGVYGDAIVASVADAREVCAQIPQLTVGEWDRSTAELVAPSVQDRTRMAGTGR